MSHVIDKNFDNRIVRGLLRRQPTLDSVCVPDTLDRLGLPDDLVLAWAAKEGRTLLTHDVKTITAPVLARLEEEWVGQIHYLPLKAARPPPQSKEK